MARADQQALRCIPADGAAGVRADRVEGHEPAVRELHDHARVAGGQRRRLDVAIGIVGRPELLFLDEPTAGFDPLARREFHELVHRLTDREQATVLLTTPYLEAADQLADTILVIDRGKVIANGTADQLTISQTATGYTITSLNSGVISTDTSPPCASM